MVILNGWLSSLVVGYHPVKMILTQGQGQIPGLLGYGSKIPVAILWDT
jgi:hypothetical protein